MNIRVFVWMLLVTLGMGLEVADTQAQPAQPTALTAVHRSGQTFITWTERADLAGESYRVYRHTQPITNVNLAQATLLYRVWEDSGRFYADRYQGDGGYFTRYVDRYVITDLGSQLPAGTGLLVWTLAAQDFGGGHSGQGYYAVTTTNNTDTENRTDFGPGNTTGPVTEQVEDPLPVEIMHSANGLGHAFVQYMDLRSWNPTFHAPNAHNAYWGLNAEEPAVAHAISYAYSYVIGEPSPGICGDPMPASLPVVVNLHGWGGNTYGPDLGGEQGGASQYFCAFEIRPVDISETWYFGFARNHDYRQDYQQELQVEAGDTVVNYTEQRLLRMVYDLLRHPTFGPRIDRNRLYIYGQSMGGSGTLAMTLRYPNVFAAAYASEPMTNYQTSGASGPPELDWRGDAGVKWGAVELNLPIAISGPGHWADHLLRYQGTGVWDWQNHQANLQNRRGDNMVPFGIGHGRNDMVIGWPTQGQPAYAALNASRQCWGGAVTASDHTWLSFQGMPVNLEEIDYVPFARFGIVLNESVPGFSNVSDNPPLPPTADGLYNHSIEWSASWRNWDGPPMETADQWRITLRSMSGSTLTADITPRRLQLCQIMPGAEYIWENQQLPAGPSLVSGTAIADASGLVTMSSVTISPEGNRLILRLNGPPPTPTATPTGTLPTSTATSVQPVNTPTNSPAPASPTPENSPGLTPTTPPQTPPPDGTPRPWPNTWEGIHVFNDQLSSLNPELIAFSATHYDGTQKMTRADADLLHAVNPNFLILHYRLGQGLGYRLADDNCIANGDWLAIINGDWSQEWPGDGAVQDSWFFQYTNQRVYDCAYGYWLMALDDPGWRNWWSTAVMAQMAANDDDGLFADSFSVPTFLGDRLMPEIPAYDPTFENDWISRMNDFMTYLMGRFNGRYYYIPNAGGWVNSRADADYSRADGVMIEGFGNDALQDFGAGDWELQMNRALSLVTQNKIILAQCYRLDTPADRMRSVACYLLIKGQRTYLNLDLAQEVDWFPEYQLPIGHPAGPAPATMDGLFRPDWGVYARTYSNGVALINVSDATATTDLGAAYYLASPQGGGYVPDDGVLPATWTIGYTPVSQLVLPPGEAAVLVTDPNAQPIATYTPAPGETPSPVISPATETPGPEDTFTPAIQPATPTPQPSTVVTPWPEDINRDGKVDKADLLLLMRRWGAVQTGL